jgi:hypothetical protein
MRGEVAAMALPGVVVMRTGISIDDPYANQLAHMEALGRQLGYG